MKPGEAMAMVARPTLSGSMRARQAHKEGIVTDVSTEQIEQRIRAKMWTPRYAPYRRA